MEERLMKRNGKGSAKRITKRITALFVLLSMIIAAAPQSWALESGNDPEDPAAISLEEGSYAPGEAIVLFRDGAVKEKEMSLKAARALPDVGRNYGMSLKAAGCADEAADAAKSEAAILEESLGDGFTLEDSLVFPAVEQVSQDAEENAGADDGEAQRKLKLSTESSNGIKLSSESSDGIKLQSDDDQGAAEGDLHIALVKSEKYETEVLIEKLKENENIAAAEPNSYMHLEEYDDYALNDTYARYLYQVNSPLAKNTAGNSVDERGEMAERAEEAVSTNAASAWKKLKGDEKEVVVAVVDTGINAEHEDLKDRMWVNDPEKTGLSGEHGYNFGSNNTDITDNAGHGTHCSGIIAAQANNGKGIAGITGGAPVKIMMLKSIIEGTTGSLYVTFGAFSYVLRAKAAGVNVVATSNSWGRSDVDSSVYREIMDRMGEAGILTFVAAGNERMNLDRAVTIPASSESPYCVTIGSAGITGEPSGFTNYGKSTVDVFAPGLNILSTVGVTTYFPSLYDAEELARTTAYYGVFDKDTAVTKKADGKNDSVTPGKGLGDGTVKEFGESVFRVQKTGSGDTGDGKESEATCELEIVPEHYYTIRDNAASLKVTIRNANIGEQYFLYFPYEKDPATTGCNNTRFSAFFESGDVPDSAECRVFGGEVVEDADGSLDLAGSGIKGHMLNEANKFVGTHTISPESGDSIIPYDELDGRKTGIGIRITPGAFSDGSRAWKEEKPQDLTLYIDSVAVSKPDVSIDRNSSYEMMSGTSMACPAAAGASALIAALDPRADGESGADYASRIKAKLLSCAHKTAALKDMCKTGGFIDLSLLDDQNPAPAITDAVCNAKNKTITLTGTGLKDGVRLSYRRLRVDGSEAVELPADGMTVEYAADGKSAVIKGAEALFGTYTEFIAASGSRTRSASFFLVKGQKKIEMAATRLMPNPAEYDYLRKIQPYRALFTDADGSGLYAMDKGNATISRFDGEKFVELPDTEIKDSVHAFLLEQGYDKYQVINDFMLGMEIGDKPITVGDRVYGLVTLTYQPGMEKHEDDEVRVMNYLASLDVTSDEPAWTFEEFDPPEVEGTDIIRYFYQAAGSTIYAIGLPSDASDMPLLSCDLSAPASSREWKREQDLPTVLNYITTASYKGKLYLFFGTKNMESWESDDELLSDDVWCFDGSSWKKTGTLTFIGKDNSHHNVAPEFLKFPVEAANGLVFVDCSVDGLGSTFLYDPEKDKGTPLYMTINDGLSDDTYFSMTSCAITREGVFYLRDRGDEARAGWALYKIPAGSDSVQVPFATLSKTQLTMKAGQEVKISVSYGKVKSWSSSNTKVLTVKNGLVTALKKGAATVTATLTTGKKLTCSITVTTSPTLSKSSISIKRGKTSKVTISGKAPSVNNVYKNTKTAKITSKKTATTLKVKALKKGTTTLKIKVNGLWLKLKVKVN